MHVVGLDIGGANLKAAGADGTAVTRSFAVWKSPERLATALAELLADFPTAKLVAVTMTAELADCFVTKADGVDFVLRAVEEASGGRAIQVWQTGAEFVPPQVARDIPLLVAAANWHALATWLGRLAPDGAAILLDVGSTTTDIVPLLNGVPVPHGFTDGERLQSGELVYSGVRRTPVCAIAHSVPFRDGYCPLAAELFATTLDVYLLLGRIVEDPADLDTANGKPATKAAAHDRLARALCCDRTEVSFEEAESIARFLADVQKQRIVGALERVLKRLNGDCVRVLLSGSGTFLAEKIAQGHPQLQHAEAISVVETFGGRAAEAACALAVARLASERLA